MQLADHIKVKCLGQWLSSLERSEMEDIRSRDNGPQVVSHKTGTWKPENQHLYGSQWRVGTS